MEGPLVTVICLCYNHESFVKEALESVIHQTYPHVEIIVVDDASTDGSVATIRETIAGYPHIKFLALEKNQGNCKAFNQGLVLAKGEYIIDFATDDVMMPARISRQVEFFAGLDTTYGVIFTDALYIDESGKPFRDHYEYLFRKKLLSSIPQGDVYKDVLDKYFISSPTMMIRRKVLEDLQGYDEDLAYEDFDFWVRSARTYRYAFLNQKLTKVRRVRRSLSSRQYTRGDLQLHSTYLVCRKAQTLNKTAEEHEALIKRVRYELRQSAFSQNYREANLFYGLLTALGGRGRADIFLYILNQLRLPLSILRKLYHNIKFR